MPDGESLSWRRGVFPHSLVKRRAGAGAQSWHSFQKTLGAGPALANHPDDRHVGHLCEYRDQCHDNARDGDSSIDGNGFVDATSLGADQTVHPQNAAGEPIDGVGPAHILR